MKATHALRPAAGIPFIGVSLAFMEIKTPVLPGKSFRPSWESILQSFRGKSFSLPGDQSNSSSGENTSVLLGN